MTTQGRTRGSRRTLGKQICYWRDRRRLTQEELAALAGVSEDAVKSLEQGRRPNPRILTVLKVAAALGLGLDELLAEPDPVEW